MKDNKEKTVTLLKSAITVGVLILAAVIFFTGSVKVEFGKDSFTLDATMTSAKSIEYKGITSVEYKEGFERGHRSFGIGTKTISAGKFKNDLLGSYQLYAWSSCDDVIIVHTKDGDYAFNGKSQEDTEKLYKELKEYIMGE